ncbi:hypothetical protein [Pedobacter sp. AJM]|uniref:hypothetical protein n=1 Tax=Pedobacter sp. AJM TaxID=2003629 RepID=UPI000B4B484C|nr:hypothetical protein [Pedobacter sp. AJM]OWK69684.1 hypothetical protein CBW18_16205 [Pedobacter sp. AJM]
MEELMNQVKSFLGSKAQNIFKKGPAEIEIKVKEGVDAQKLAEDLKQHIVALISEDTIAMISLVDHREMPVDHFSLNQ